MRMMQLRSVQNLMYYILLTPILKHLASYNVKKNNTTNNL